MKPLLKNTQCLVVLGAVVLMSGCASVYNSSCHELSVESNSELKRMVRKASKGIVKRHVILLETGSDLSNSCQSHFITEDVYRGIPESLEKWCREQGSSSDKYCALYRLDNKVVKQRIY